MPQSNVIRQTVNSTGSPSLDRYLESVRELERVSKVPQEPERKAKAVVVKEEKLQHK